MNPFSGYYPAQIQATGTQAVADGFLSRTRAAYCRTTEGPLCRADWHSLTGLLGLEALPVAAPLRWNVYSENEALH